MYDYLHLCTTSVYNKSMNANTKPLAAYIRRLMRHRNKMSAKHLQETAAIANNYLWRLENESREVERPKVRAMIDVLQGDPDHIDMLLRPDADEKMAWHLAEQVIAKEKEAEAHQSRVRRLSDEQLEEEAERFKSKIASNPSLLDKWNSLSDEEGD